ncbi:hypothetical protein DNU06_14805 [Putridiphycobacter roseus]|uniref:Sensor of ECF-type sigma factor n=1 Tax=Putridiphycobacter roseus TaxID=2219161 RepID=A0A2W1MW53_9FLAO|nr:hypothetical protein [Putridiphycobacter roseus]PZE16067.1 hypothetical protein DNU06_14805 [Putridiphycobacter roseus]
MKTKILFLLLILSFGTATFAQKGHIDREQIEKEKKAFITKAMTLTASEAKVFWSKYEAYESEKRNLHREARKIKYALKSQDVLSEDEAYDLIEKMLKLEEKSAKMELRYLSEFASVVGKDKAVKFFKAQDDFKREIFKKLKNLPPPPPKTD